MILTETEINELRNKIEALTSTSTSTLTSTSLYCKDDDFLVRAEVAKQGLSLETLVNDANYLVRLVAREAVCK